MRNKSKSNKDEWWNENVLLPKEYALSSQEVVDLVRKTARRTDTGKTIMNPLDFVDTQEGSKRIAFIGTVYDDLPSVINEALSLFTLRTN